MKKIAAAVLLSAVVAAPAFAADEGFYAGLSLGNGKPGVSPAANVAVNKSSNFIYGGLAGYQYNKNLAVEAQFTGVGKSTDVNGNSLKADALSLTAVGLLPLNDSFELLGKLGVASTKTTSSGLTATNLGTTRTGLTYGLGAQYNVSKNLGLRLVWDRYALATSSATGVKSNANADVVAVAAVYKF